MREYCLFAARAEKRDDKQSRVIESNENASLQGDFAVFTLFIRAVHAKTVYTTICIFRHRRRRRRDNPFRALMPLCLLFAIVRFVVVVLPIFLYL